MGFLETHKINTINALTCKEFAQPFFQFKETMNIPMPVFVSCDETSLKVKVIESQAGDAPNESFPPKGFKLKLECKETHQEWTEARRIEVDEQNTFNGEDIGDLEPGNPYFIRFVLISDVDGSVQCGPETVFDTKPVDCTPKTEKKCIIS